MRLAVLYLLLLGCGPVMLGEEQGLPDPGSNTEGEGDASPITEAPASGQDAGLPPVVAVRIKPLDCGRCFDLQAEGSGGQPPYDFEWENGSLGGLRRVCVDGTDVALTVVAVDAAAARSLPQTIHLEGAADASCAEAPAEPDAGPPPRLCLENASFEGTATSFDQAPAFDAPPWSTCTNPMRTNTPAIGNDTVSVTGSVPPPTDGLTYVALGEGQQVSQPLCSDVPDGAPLHLELDLSRIDLGAGVVPQTEQVFLEIWGGLAVDCSQHELLWASEALQAGWQHFCVTLQPDSFMTQLTLRANSDMTLASPAYLLVDNLQPVDSCP